MQNLPQLPNFSLKRGSLLFFLTRPKCPFSVADHLHWYSQQHLSSRVHNQSDRNHHLLISKSSHHLPRPHNPQICQMMVLLFLHMLLGERGRGTWPEDHSTNFDLWSWQRIRLCIWRSVFLYFVYHCISDLLSANGAQNLCHQNFTSQDWLKLNSTRGEC